MQQLESTTAKDFQAIYKKIDDPQERKQVIDYITNKIGNKALLKDNGPKTQE